MFGLDFRLVKATFFVKILKLDLWSTTLYIVQYRKIYVTAKVLQHFISANKTTIAKLNKLQKHFLPTAVFLVKHVSRPFFSTYSNATLVVITSKL